MRNFSEIIAHLSALSAFFPSWKREEKVIAWVKITLRAGTRDPLVVAMAGQINIITLAVNKGPVDVFPAAHNVS